MPFSIIIVVSNLAHYHTITTKLSNYYYATHDSNVDYYKGRKTSKPKENSL